MRKIWLFCGLFLVLSWQIRAQVVTSDQKFPLAWVGKWSGELRIEGPGGLLQQFPMSLGITPISAGRYSWTIQYGLDSAGLRPYTLVVVDSSLGHYQIDEHNGIVLDAYLRGNKLYSQFAVEDYLLLSTEELRGEELHYEIIAGPREPIHTTGNGEHQGETIPSVSVYGINVRQVAILRRQE